MAPEQVVVVVEDDPSIADLVDTYLRRDGFRVYLAADGETALKTIKDRQPKLLILDLGLPGLIDGIEVCRQVRSCSDIPIIMLTARDDELDRVLGLELGADDYVTKPFSPRARGAGQGHPAPRRSSGGRARDHHRRCGRGRSRPPRSPPHRAAGRARDPRVRPLAVSVREPRTGAVSGANCSTAYGGSTGSATTARSTCMSASCARSSATRCRSTPCGVSGIAWADG